MTSITSIAARFALSGIAVACVAWPLETAAATGPTETKAILVLHTYGQHSMFRPVFDRALQQALTQRGLGDTEVFVETLESNRVPGGAQGDFFRSYLGQKYANRRIDVVIAVWDRALDYVIANGDELFPNAAIAAVVARPRAFKSDLQVAQVTAGNQVLATVELALQLQPEKRRVFVVDGSLESSEDMQAFVTAQLAPLASRITVDFLRNLPLADLLTRVKGLSADSIVVFGRQTMRTRTQSMTQMEAVDQVVAASPVAVYALSDQIIGRGVMGGVVFNTEALAKLAADSATQLINGTPQHDSAVRAPNGIATVDFRQLRKWNVSLSRVPDGTDIQFREYTFWEQNQAYIAGAITVFLIQSGLIAALLIQRARRRKAEGALRVNEHALHVSQEDTRKLAGRLIAAQEIERARIARELHDDLSQKLALLSMDIHQIAMGDTPGLRGRAKLMAERAAEIGTGLHNLSHELHPAKLQILGLVTATQQLCRDLAAHHQMSIEFLHDHMPSNEAPDQALCLYRITQEALQNVVKHSGAHAAVVRLTGFPDSLQLEISDTGSGFDMSQLGDGMGLLSMRERVSFLGGHIKIWSKPGLGTCVSVQVPFAPAEKTVEQASERIA